MGVEAGDASRALDKKAADGIGTDKTMKICLESFLDAAHGNQVSHQTMDTRKGMMRDCKKPKHPDDPYTDPVTTELADTNVTCTLMCQDDCFIDFFVKIAEKYSVGIPQRFQIEYGGDCDPPDVRHNHFYSWIFVESFRRMLTLVL